MGNYKKFLMTAMFLPVIALSILPLVITPSKAVLSGVYTIEPTLVMLDGHSGGTNGPNWLTTYGYGAAATWFDDETGTARTSFHLPSNYVTGTDVNITFYTISSKTIKVQWKYYFKPISSGTGTGNWYLNDVEGPCHSYTANRWKKGTITLTYASGVLAPGYSLGLIFYPSNFTTGVSSDKLTLNSIHLHYMGYHQDSKTVSPNLVVADGTDFNALGGANYSSAYGYGTSVEWRPSETNALRLTFIIPPSYSSSTSATFKFRSIAQITTNVQWYYSFKHYQDGSTSGWTLSDQAGPTVDYQANKWTDGSLTISSSYLATKRSIGILLWPNNFTGSSGDRLAITDVWLEYTGDAATERVLQPSLTMVDGSDADVSNGAWWSSYYGYGGAVHWNTDETGLMRYSFIIPDDYDSSSGATLRMMTMSEVGSVTTQWKYSLKSYSDGSYSTTGWDLQNQEIAVQTYAFSSRWYELSLTISSGYLVKEQLIGIVIYPANFSETNKRIGLTNVWLEYPAEHEEIPEFPLTIQASVFLIATLTSSGVMMKKKKKRIPR
jgi:hypothetical protein